MSSYFINKANKAHNNKYDYSLVKYVDSKTKVKIICPKHGLFEQVPNNHLRQGGCPKCSNEKKSKLYSLKSEDFIKKAISVHGDKYDYSKTIYKNSYTKVKITCPEHGEFKQIPGNHITNKRGCQKCSQKEKGEKLSSNTAEFINKSKYIHNNKYNYSEVNYKNAHTKVIINCPTHGKFKQSPNSHLSGVGCPVCKNSKGEEKIRKLLQKNDIKFDYQKTFNDCKNINKLYFDFYLPDHNLCIEYDGLQHFKAIKHFGGKAGLIKTQKRDKIKNEYCKANNIRLLRIKYNEKVSKLLSIL